MFSYRGSTPPRDQTCVCCGSCIADRFFTVPEAESTCRGAWCVLVVLWVIEQHIVKAQWHRHITARGWGQSE